MPRIRKLPSELISKKILGVILDDLAAYGSIPIYALFTLAVYFSGNILLFERLLYCFAISVTLILVIKGVHYKERPQKEEFTIFMEKVMAMSFPSAHSLNGTVLTILLWIAFPFLWVQIITAFLLLSTYFQRYIRKKHFVADIIGGLLLAIIEVVFVIRVL